MPHPLDVYPLQTAARSADAIAMANAHKGHRQRRQHRAARHGAKRARPHGRAKTHLRATAPGTLAVYGGRFGPEQAERLLWRAGFGPRQGQARALAHRGLRAAVLSLTRPHDRSLRGPNPHLDDGTPLAPYDKWGNDVLWWLDRMVRSSAPLIERMTLIWHDWFATSNNGVDSQRLMIAQNQTQRVLCLTSFPRMLAAMTTDPAMLLWLSGAGSTKEAPNENYAREMQELFGLGAGRGYTEADVREHARALTGWDYKWDEATGQQVNFHFDPTQHDDGVKVIYGHRGRFDWRDSVRLVLAHPLHPSHLVTKLWSYFCPQPLSRSDQRAAEALYTSSGGALRPLIEAFLMHPLLYRGPRMVKPPIVQIAGMLRGIGRYIDTDAWVWESGLAGQTPFYPPNVAGWDATRWLNTGTWLARFNLASQVIGDERELKSEPDSRHARTVVDPRALAERAIAFWGSPTLSAHTHGTLVAYAKAAAIDAATASWEREAYAVLAENALRALAAASPDYQTC
jgi:uncharacterized protein (DUF1800 family)